MIAADDSDCALVMRVSLRMARESANVGRLNSFVQGMHAGRVQAAEFLSSSAEDKLMAQSVANELRFLRRYQARYFPLSGD